MNISQKLTLGFIAAIALPLVIIAVLIISQTRQHSLEAFSELAGREALQVDNGINIFFDEVSKNVTFLSSHPDIKAAKQQLYSYLNSTEAIEIDARSVSDEQTNAYELFELFGNTHDGIAYIYMGNEQGEYLQWPQGKVSPGYDPRTRPWYQLGKNATTDTVRTDAYYWAPDDMSIVSTVRAIESEGRVVGVQGMDVSLKGLTKMIQNIKLGETGYLILVEHTGTVLVDAQHPEFRFKEFAEVANGRYRDLAENSQGLFELTIGDTEYFANIYTSERLGWKFIGVVTQQEVMSAANQMTVSIIVISLILLVVFVLLAGYLSKLISRPIVKVTEGLTLISKGGGDLTQRLTIHTKDETAQLAQSFNQFLDLIADLVRQINECAEQLSATAQTTASQSEELTGSTVQQQQSLEMAATAINEMAATANEVAASCANAAELAIQTQNASELGKSVISDTVLSVESMSQTITKATSEITQLDSESENIMSILSVIRGIAEQTNLLALNAAIEAARAGDHGRGFAVVADEVRALSQRTSESTEEIAAQLDKLRKMSEGVSQEMQLSLASTTKTVEMSQSAQSQFSEITHSIQTISDLNTQIATAAEEQQHVAEDINRNVVEIKHAAENVSEVSQSTSESGVHVSGLARKLTKLVGEFKV